MDVGDAHGEPAAQEASGWACYRDGASVGLMRARADGVFLGVNAVWAAALGYQCPEQYLAEVGCVGEMWVDPAQHEELVALAECGCANGFQARLRRRDGDVAWVALDAEAVRDQAGVLLEVHIRGVDITDRKLAEQTLRESEARFRSVFLHSLDGILLTSAAGRILSANPAACQILDRTETQLCALDRGALFDPAEDRLTAALRPRAGRGPAYAELAMLRPDGSSFPAEITCSAFTDADGAQNISMIIRDVSERRGIEEELRRANRAKSEFLSRMSHELRTPMNAVLGFAQLLELDVGDQLRPSVEQIRRAGTHLLNLINEILDISRIEAGELAMSAEAVQLHELLAETVAMMTPIAAAAAVALDIAAESNVRLYVRADRQRLRQVLLNLLSNAVKYNRSGGTVSIRCHQRGDAVVAIAVRDTGLGLGPADQARLFTPFERLGAAASDIEGSGVGLALSQRLTQAMGGQISVDSALGQGSTFTVELPAARPGPARMTGPAPGPGPGHPAPAGDPTRARLLSVEDNPANIRLLEAIMRRRPGWELTHAGYGQLGLDLATAHPPDLILLDLHLPDTPGIEVLHRLKACPDTAAVPVIVVSADATPGQVERLHRAGATAYLTKPIDVAELLRLLDTIASSSTRPPPAAEAHQG